jgi:hypothetical protein
MKCTWHGHLMNAFELGLSTMKSLTKTELRAVRAICELNYTNPFTAKRLELEQVALGGEFETEEIGFWSHIDPRNPTKRKNLVRVVAKSKMLLTKLRGDILGGEQLDPEHVQLYADLAYFVLFDELLGRKHGNDIRSSLIIGLKFLDSVMCRIGRSAICLQFFIRSTEHFSRSSIALWGNPSRRRNCVHAFGNPFSRSTCAAIEIACTNTFLK